jgi:hypothetical protein
MLTLQQKNKNRNMKIYIPFMCMSVLLSGCIFSGNDIEETEILDPYYIQFSGINHQLIAKETEARTSKVIVSTDIDSIGHFDNFIFGKTGSRYFIFDTKTKKFYGEYNNLSLFREAKQKLNLYIEMKSTN